MHHRITIRVRSGLSLFLFNWTQARMISYRPYSKGSTIFSVDSMLQRQTELPLVRYKSFLSTLENRMTLCLLNDLTSENDATLHEAAIDNIFYCAIIVCMDRFCD